MFPRLRWVLAASALALPLVLIVPMPAQAQLCDVLNALGACTASGSGLEFNPDGTISVPGGSPAPAPPAPAPTSVPKLLPDAALRLLDLANQERARVGAPPLVFRDDVVRMATAHTQKMLGSNGGIFHNLDLLTKPLRNVLGAQTVGENVGWSTHLEELHPRFMASPAHRAALLDPRFTVAGFAVIQDTDGLYYATQDFVQPSGATPPPPPAPHAAAPPAPRSGGAAPARVATPAPAPGRAVAVQPVVAEAVADPAEPSVDGGQAAVEETALDGAGIDVDASGALALGEVAGLISEDPAPTPSAGRSGAVALASALVATALGGLGWSQVRGRRSSASTAMRQQLG